MEYALDIYLYSEFFQVEICLGQICNIISITFHIPDKGLVLLLAMTNDLMMYDLGLTFPPHFPAHCLYYQGQQSANQT